MKIISGGQTGVDQAALRVAEALGIEAGGWCPPGRVCESGRIPDRFPLQETPEERSVRAREVPRSMRTEWNVRDADATLILRLIPTESSSHRDPGTIWTFECAILYGKALLLCGVGEAMDANPRMVRTWLNSLKVRTLNVAGPAESRQPGIGRLAEEFLLKIFE
jgi:Circularly permutated YpsA SLOG family